MGRSKDVRTLDEKNIAALLAAKDNLLNTPEEPKKKVHEKNESSSTIYTSFEDMGRVSTKGDWLYLTVETNKGPVSLEINNHTPNNSIVEVGVNHVNVRNKNWADFKNTPEDISRALAANGFVIEKKELKPETNTSEQSEAKKTIEQKADGAVDQIDKTVELNAETEASLGQDLTTNGEFSEEAEKINLLRSLVAGVAEHAINKETENTEKVEIAEDKIEQARIELEKKITDPFTRAAYDKLAERNKIVLLGYLVKRGMKPEKSQIIKMERITWADQNVVHFSDNGYLMKLTNKKEISEKGKKLDLENEKALYMLVSPDDQIIARNLHYNVALSTLEKKAESYHIQLNKEFNGEIDATEPSSEIVFSKEELLHWVKLIKINGDTEEDLLDDETFKRLIPRQQKILLRYCKELNDKLESEPYSPEDFQKFFDTIKGSTLLREDVITTDHFRVYCTKEQKKKVLDYFDEKAKAAALIAPAEPAVSKKESVGIPKDIPEADALSQEEFAKYFKEMQDSDIARDVVIADDKFKNNCNNDQKREILKHFDKPAAAEITKEEFDAMSLKVKNGEIKREELLVSPEYLNLSKLRQDILVQQLVIKEKADVDEKNAADNLKGASEEYLNQYIKQAATLELDKVSSSDWFLTLPTQQRNLVLNACIKPDQTLTAASDEDFARYSDMALVSTPKNITSQEWFETLIVEQRTAVLNLCLKVSPDFSKHTQEDFKNHINILELKTPEEVKASDWFKDLTPEQQEIALNSFPKPDSGSKVKEPSEQDLLNFESQIKASKMTEETLKEDAVFKTLKPEHQARLLKSCEKAPASLDPVVIEYSESIGIEKEELKQFPEFLRLKPEEQKLILETLRRSSLIIAKAQGRENFAEEKGKKSFFQRIGFNLNENYNKKKFEVQAIQAIEEKGLSGYSQSEFALLIGIVSNGLEVKENGDVNFLVENRMSDGVNKKLIGDYNRAARTYIEFPKNTNNEEALEMIYQAKKHLYKIKDEILRTASPEDMANLREAEKNIKLFDYLSANKETEEIVDKLSSETMTGGSKAKMMLSAHGDKAGYMAGGMALKTVARLSMGLNFAIAPAVAAILGGLRAYNTNSRDINEKELYAQLGFKDTDKSTSKFSKTMNQAFAEKEDGQGVGLSNKLDSLVSRYEIVQEKIKTETDPVEIEKNNKERESVTSLLNHRIQYTIGRMNDHEVSYGPAEERGINFYNLSESLIAAQAAVSYDLNPLNKISNYNENLNGKTTKLTRANIEYKKLPKIKGESEVAYNERVKQMNAEYFEVAKTGEMNGFVYNHITDYRAGNKKYLNLVNDENRLNKLHRLGFEDRLASFMGYKEDVRANKEFVYMTKKVLVGAAIGASFAAAGIWVAEKLGLDVWAAEKWGSFKGLFSNHDATQAVNPVVKVPGAETAIPKAPAPKVPTPEVNKNIVGTDKISNEGLNGKHDSVWRSLREIFKNKSGELGYKGDPNDAAALNKWAETQTANTLNHSGDITDRVTEGNEVTLMREGDHLKAVVSQGTGGHPGHLDHAAGGAQEHIASNANNTETPSVDTPAADTPTEKVLYNNVYKPIPANNNADRLREMVDVKNAMEKNAAIDALEAKVLAQNLHFKPENLTRINTDHFSYKIPGKGEVMLGLKQGTTVIERLYDSSGKSVPTELINELKRNLSVDRFVGRGGLDKVFSTWNSLSSNDKTIYQDMVNLGKNGLTPEAFFKKMSDLFHVNTQDNVFVDIDGKHLIAEGNRTFDMTLKGLGKFLKVLARRG